MAVLARQTPLEDQPPHRWRDACPRDAREFEHGWLGEDCFAIWELFSHLVVGWPVYLFCNVTGGRRLKGQILEKPVPFKLGLVDHFRPGSPLFPDSWSIRIALSALGCLITLCGLAVATGKFGVLAVSVHYGMP